MIKEPNSVNLSRKKFKNIQVDKPPKIKTSDGLIFSMCLVTYF